MSDDKFDCPYCKDINFQGLEINSMHLHLAECSKKYIDKQTKKIRWDIRILKIKTDHR